MSALELMQRQAVRGSKEWAEQQLRLIGKSPRAITLKRINAVLVAAGYPPLPRVRPLVCKLSDGAAQ